MVTAFYLLVLIFEMWKPTFQDYLTNGLDVDINIFLFSTNILDVSINILDVDINMLYASINILDFGSYISNVGTNMLNNCKNFRCWYQHLNGCSNLLDVKDNILDVDTISLVVANNIEITSIAYALFQPYSLWNDIVPKIHL